MLPDVGTDIRVTLTVHNYVVQLCPLSMVNVTYDSNILLSISQVCLLFLGICNSTLVYHNVASGE